ncbi:MAG: flagellar hook-basal body complex protein [Alphaproteobacteria bacterium]|nr:flagellar hook-basal body complex protein [Alphaproteobacteria bacterium]
MSLYGALFSGVSGLSAQSSAMGAISDNVTNVNTNGYKGTKVNFQTLITKQAASTKYSAGGVQSKPRQNVDLQGLLQSSSSATDVAVSGDGFFVTSDAANPIAGNMFSYTRAGSFKVDRSGYLQNVGGWYVQGWPLLPHDNSTQAVSVTVGNDTFMKAYKDTAGVTSYINDNIVSATHLKPLNLNEVGGTAQQTRAIRMGANLPSTDADGTTHKTNVLTYDSLGNASNLQLTWTKMSTNNWDLEVAPPLGSTTLTLKDGTTNANVYASMGRVDFLKEPGNGDSFTIKAGTDNGGAARTFTFSYNNTGTNDLTDGNNNATYTIDVAARTASQTIDAAVASVNDALNRAYPGITGSVAAVNQTAGGNIIFTDSAGTSTTIALAAAATPAVCAAAINANATLGTTGLVHATVNDAGMLELATTDTSGYTITSSVAAVLDDLGIDNTVTTTQADTVLTGKVYAERPASTDSMLLRQASTANDTVVDLTNLNVTAPSTKGATQQAVTQPFSITKISTTLTPSSTAAIHFAGDGTPTDPSTTTNAFNVASVDVTWANGSEDQTGSDKMSLFLGNENVADGMTQFAGAYQISYITQNGAQFGNFAGVSISREGLVTALFDNGVTRPVFQIPLATFINPNGMESLTGNVWIETDFSGQPTMRTAGSAGAGEINGGSLEASTVDLGEEFTAMITTQRAYSASAKIITTADEMLDELVRIKR